MLQGQLSSSTKGQFLTKYLRYKLCHELFQYFSFYNLEFMILICKDLIDVIINCFPFG